MSALNSVNSNNKHNENQIIKRLIKENSLMSRNLEVLTNKIIDLQLNQARDNQNHSNQINEHAAKLNELTNLYNSNLEQIQALRNEANNRRDQDAKQEEPNQLPQRNITVYTRRTGNPFRPNVHLSDGTVFNVNNLLNGIGRWRQNDPIDVRPVRKCMPSPDNHVLYNSSTQNEVDGHPNPT